MKLKKLLPLISLTGVAAVVAPLVTSCTSAKTYSYFFDASKPAANWSPKDTTGKAEAVELTSTKDALDLFLNASKKNNEVLADNILYSLIQYYMDVRDVPDRGTADITINKVDTKTKKLSFDIKTSITNKNRTEGINIDVKINSLKFEMGYVHFANADDGKWVLTPSIYNLSRVTDLNTVIAYLMSDHEWSCSMNVASQYLEDKDIYVEYNCNSSWEELRMFLERGVKEFRWLSFDNLYYMQDVTYKAPTK